MSKLLRGSGLLVAAAVAVGGGIVRADDNGLMDQQLKNGLVLHLPLDGNGQDKSKNKLDGEVCGAVPTDGHSGPGSLGLEFDGVDDYVDLSAALTKVNALSKGSISLWFRVDQAPDQFPNRALGIPQTEQITFPVLYMGKIDTVTGNNSLMVHPIHPNARPTAWFTIVRNELNALVPPWFCFDTCYFPLPRTNNAVSCAGPGWHLLTAGEWYHYVVTVDPTGNHGYLNGEELVERRFNPNRERPQYINAPVGAGPPAEASDVEFFDDVLGPTSFKLGAGVWGYATFERFMDGAIDEVRIYDRALTADEVEALYLLDDYADDLDANPNPHDCGNQPGNGHAYGVDHDPTVSPWLGVDPI
jgi:hypothetical protein